MSDAFWTAFWAFAGVVVVTLTPIAVLLVKLIRKTNIIEVKTDTIAVKATEIEVKQEEAKADTKVVHDLVNSRMTEMLALAKKTSRAIGVAAGKVTEKAAEKKRSPAKKKKTIRKR